MIHHNCGGGFPAHEPAAPQHFSPSPARHRPHSRHGTFLENARIVLWRHCAPLERRSKLLLQARLTLGRGHPTTATWFVIRIGKGRLLMLGKVVLIAVCARVEDAHAVPELPQPSRTRQWTLVTAIVSRFFSIAHGLSQHQDRVDRSSSLQASGLTAALTFQVQL